MPEERKLASIVFADIIESTAHGATVDPELARKTFARVFGEMREALTSHGGTVEKFVGDAVMAVFGVPVAHDDDAERAVRAAFAMRERIAALAPTLAFPIGLRIGVNSGQIVAGDPGADTLVTGLAVNVAARLQQHAAADEILVGPLTRTLTEGAVHYGDTRRVEAKGIGSIDATPAVALASTIPEQHRGLGQLRAPLIGRDAELRLLLESYRKAGEERAAYLVTVYGQAGVGKSRLIRELAEVVGPERVLRGRCLSYGVGITYWPLQEMIRADLKIGPADSRDEAKHKLRSGVLEAFGEATDDAEAVARRLAVVAGLERAEDALHGTTGNQLGQELRWGVRRYFEQRAATTPLTLIVDDIHWAEEPMLEMIEHLAEWSRAGLFIVCLARPELRDRRPSWGGGLMNAAAVRLEPLSVDETRRLIAALLAIDDLPDSLRSKITDRTQGNPLYVEELLRMLIGAGHIARREGRWVSVSSIAGAVVPETLQGLLTARLDQLPTEIKRLLQRASVVGKVFYPDALAALGHAEGDISELLTAAARRDFVNQRDERGPGGGRAWHFNHILIRDVAYDSLPKEERARMHDAMGTWLETVAGERRDEYAEIVAHHAYEAYRLAKDVRAPSVDSLGERALDLLLIAARRARREDERAASLVLFGRARDVVADIATPIEKRIEATAFAALAREAVEGLGAARQDLDAALALARAAPPSQALVQLLMFEARELGDGNQQANSLGAEAVAAARALGDHDLVVEALLGEAWGPWFAGDIERCGVMLADARAYALAHNSRRHLEFLAARESHVAQALGDFATLERAQRDWTDAARVHESKILRAVSPAQSTQRVAQIRGDYATARQAADEWIRLVPELGLPGTGAYRALGEALLGLDRYAEAVESLAESLRRMERRGTSPAFVGETRQLLARAYLGAGRLSEAKESAERAYREIADEDAFSRSTTAVALAMVRAVEQNVAEADRLFRVAIESARDYRDLAVEARISYARFLVDQGRAADAREHLRIAADFFAHPSVARRRAQVDELLRRCDEVRA